MSTNMKSQRWSDYTLARLEQLYDAGEAWAVIAVKLQRTEGACRTKMSEIHKRRLKATSVGSVAPKKRINGEKWTPEKIDILMTMVDGFKAQGLRPHWREVSEATGHHIASCQVKYANIASRGNGLKARATIDRRIELGDVALEIPSLDDPPPKPRVQTPEFSRPSTSTDRFRYDAELRRRIAILGVTGGLQGDPEPGRSALDKRNAGIVDEPWINREQDWHDKRMAKITLPTEPLR